jgi:carbamoyltransferase
MKILGISCYYHDSAAALVDGDKVIAAVEEERFTRIKHDFGFPEKSINFCLNYAGISAAELDAVVFYEKPLSKFHRMIRSAREFTPESWEGFSSKAIRHCHVELEIENCFREVFRYDNEFLYSEHHLSHGASAYYCSPFNRAAVLTVDGVGEHATATIGKGGGAKYEILQELHYPVSLGLFYSALTAFLGFSVNNDEYKVMGLASYGKPRFKSQLDELIHSGPDGSIVMNLDYFCYFKSEVKMYTEKLEELLGPPRIPGRKPGSREADLAASVQAKLEELYLALLNKAHEATGEKNICLAGGVALNGVANWKCFNESAFERIFVQPAAGDSGGAIGAALAAYYRKTGVRNAAETEFTPFLGPEYSDAEIKNALDAAGLKYKKYDIDDLISETARHIAGNKIAGWFQGRMEIGPRALGCRSIIANPAGRGMKDHINLSVKFREEFRPFAPSVVEEKAEEYFELNGHSSPYMLLVPQARRGVDEIIPAVVHVDNSARVQTVSKSMNLMYHRLISAVGDITGVPVVLNTSFNIKSEPIVCTPAQAVTCFLNTGIDVLAIGNYIAEKVI